MTDQNRQMMADLVAKAKELPQEPWRFDHGKLYEDRIYLEWVGPDSIRLHRWLNLELLSNCWESGRLRDLAYHMLRKSISETAG